MDVTEHRGVLAADVEVLPGRKYVYLDVLSGRVELGTMAARTPTFELPAVPQTMVERDLGCDLEGAVRIVTDQAGGATPGRVVHVAYWPDAKACNVLVECPPDVDQTGRAW